MVTTETANTVKFKVYLPHAAKVEIIGDFTEWSSKRVPMTRHFPGWWSATADIQPGQHAFCYLVDDSIWLPDYAAHGVRLNTAGKWLSILNVHETLCAVRNALTPHTAVSA